MASTILFKRSNTAANDAYTGFLGEVTLDTQQRKLRIHDGVQLGGYTVANMSDVQSVIARVDSLEIADIAGLTAALNSINTEIDDIQATYIKKDGSVPFTGNVDAGTNKVIRVADPFDPTDAVNKRYVDAEITALGNVFSYEGSVDGGTEATPFNVTTLSETGSGSYYSVSTSGWITDGATTPKVEYVNVNDSIVFDNTGSYKVIDNTNSEINGTLDYIVVSGNPETGYTVDIDSTFKLRVETLEGDTVRSVTSTGALSVNNTDPQNPVVNIDNATQTADGSMSSVDKTKLDGIEIGAQVNTVDSVNGYTGVVSLVKSDVGLGNVDNYPTANQTQATDGNSSTHFTTPQGMRFFIEGGDYTIDGGTF